MGIGSLLDCKPADDYYNDACSSNSANTSSTSGPDPGYLPDYGLSRNISWAAKWANEYGITDYKNYAVTGSAPSDWLGSGQFSDTFRQIQAENPDFVVMTMGANPLLSDMLFGIDNMGCAIYSDLFGDYRDCIEQAFAGVDLSSNLHEIYSELVANTTSHVVLMQYHLSIPSIALAYSSAQIALMGQLLNQVIAEQAAAVSTERITVIAPPWFDVGIDMRPVHPSTYSCSYAGYKVDGPSVQSTPSQDELLLSHPLSFCSGPAIGPPWVISGDTGIHPSATGYSRMAAQMPPP
jgi:lysophospholipase L1-like esterase